MTDLVRRIIHIDMDAFYASVEQRDAPALRGRPVAVGRSQERGVVAAASYEARKFGVRSAMPSLVAQRKCPELIFVPPRFEVYRAISAQIHAIFARYTSLIQPLSLDEAYLDVTEPLFPRPFATIIAQEIRAAIYAETGLTASAGVSYNKFLAKLASDYRKPNGQFVIPPGAGEAFVADLPVNSFHGIGPATASRMNGLGIYTGADLRNHSLASLSHHFGKAAAFYYGIARGEDPRPVEPHRPRKSIGKETTYERDLHREEELYAALTPLAHNVWLACTRRQASGRTVTLKLRYVNFQQLTRSYSLTEPVASVRALEDTAHFLLRPLLPLLRPVRLLGITVSSLTSAEEKSTTEQLSLLSNF
ncbi:DNA polymerase IV [Acetobacter orleanensis]|uniref:DNA polymerase IV n=1 Tax=Acetobacter orleanensis TaxID=104099 RepID=A0A4Y3TK25_9PROT|nr:DNA polymerase IV [Acetobacter orleanensis]KXV67025.1 DNA repair protein [Acetobacter orleanensis]PCD78721.1 DNA polymerase IV [Acetobacter orleanensis]GAN67374.1 DNA polymerase IV [Acetobacter orleanensis JCM 7639]GBR23668.1 DNA polymerase IV [Acetobacter orleanensis NRIC 0473]GEB83341.1 DNA polymerase IV [Acetobacter orleanensis]